MEMNFKIGDSIEIQFPSFDIVPIPPPPPSPIPEGYTALNYIQSSGQQWLNPQMQTPSGSDTVEVQVRFAMTALTSAFQDIVAMRLYGGAYYSGYGLYFCADATNQILAKVSHPSGSGGTAIYPNIALTIGTTYDATINATDSQLTVTVSDGVNTDTVFTATSSGLTLPLTLFAVALGDSGVREYANAKMYYCRIYVNGALVHDLLPCSRDADGKIGMYDTIAQAFRTNCGSGADFTGG